MIVFLIFGCEYRIAKLILLTVTYSIYLILDRTANAVDQFNATRTMTTGSRCTRLNQERIKNNLILRSVEHTNN